MITIRYHSDIFHFPGWKEYGCALPLHEHFCNVRSQTVPKVSAKSNVELMDASIMGRDIALGSSLVRRKGHFEHLLPAYQAFLGQDFT